MSSTIGGSLYPVLIPNYSDPADIQTALKEYHFGTTTIPTNGSSLTIGVAKNLYDLEVSKAPIDSPVFVGDVTFDSDATITLPAGSVTNSMLAGSIADSKLSTISTPGKVSNSATTADSANTASAIVARDSSGNFVAGTITANLDGNVLGKVTQANGSSVGKIFVQEAEPTGASAGDLWFW